MIALCMATLLEAQPLVQALALRSIATKPFQVFADEHRCLVLTGIGKTNAAMATVHVIQQVSPTRVFNLGAAGAAKTGLGLGQIRHITQIVEPDRPHLKTGSPHVHFPHVLEGFETATLATSDKPVLAAREREAIAAMADLVDMEGAAVVQACRRWDVPCHVFKFVSDTPDQDRSAPIVTNIRAWRQAFCDYVARHVLT